MRWVSEMFRRPGIDLGTAEQHLAERAGEPPADLAGWERSGTWPDEPDPGPRRAGATAYLPAQQGPGAGAL